MSKFDLRWAQLDVARQMETIDFIEKFIVLLADSGYNGLLLYLEDRVRTASYQLPGAGECYTEDEIRHLVEFAAGRGIEIVPCVATLGHAERFLRHPELEPLAELQGDMVGRFEGKNKLTFCISHPDFYDFIGRYLKEVAALFPSHWFHVGLDEFWDYNLCPRCKKIMPTRAAEQEQFLRHILAIREIMAGQGKRIMMWSDMFEFYPDVFKRVPADVVMVDWQYQRDVRNYQGHLLDVGIEDRIAVNSAWGHDTIVAPADRTLSNSESYFEYAAGRPQVIGGLLTSWEKSDTFLYRTLAVFVAAGYQMNGLDRDAAFAAMMKQFFGTDDAVLSAAVRETLNLGMLRHFEGLGAGRVCTRDYYGLKTAALESDHAMRVILDASRTKVTTELGKRALEDMIDALDDKILAGRANRIAQEIFDRGVTAARLKKFADFRRDYGKFLDRMEAQWNIYRPGIEPNVFTLRRDRVEKNLKELEDRLSSGSWIRVGCCLPDGFGVENVQVEYQTAGTWHTAGSGVFKAADELTALFSRFIALDEDPGVPIEAVRLTAGGLGGIGVTFVEARSGGKLYVPAALQAAQGRVANPEYLLSDDTTFAWFGGQSTRSDYLDMHAAAQHHGATLGMREFSTADLVFVR